MSPANLNSKEQLVYISVAGTTSDIAENSRAAIFQLKSAMFLMCSHHIVHFWKIVKEHKFEYRELISYLAIPYLKTLVTT